MNMILDSVQSGVASLVKYLDRKAIKEAKGLELDYLKKNLVNLDKSFDSLRNQLDALVMNLPLVQFFSGFKKYDLLEKALKKEKEGQGASAFCRE